MGIMKTALLNSAAAAVLAVPLWAGLALAQETQGTDGQATDQAQQTRSPLLRPADGQQGQDDLRDTLVARLGDAEIRTSDVMQAIGQLPPRLNRLRAQAPTAAADSD